MAVPILRDVNIARPLNDPQVLLGRRPVVSAWTGRLGVDPATLTYETVELLPNGAQGTVKSGPMPPDAAHPGYHSAEMAGLTPGSYYRVTVTAADPSVPADTVAHVSHFTNTPGALPGS